jgi:hypothetical protein
MKTTPASINARRKASIVQFRCVGKEFCRIRPPDAIFEPNFCRKLLNWVGDFRSGLHPPRSPVRTDCGKHHPIGIELELRHLKPAAKVGTDLARNLRRRSRESSPGSELAPWERVLSDWVLAWVPQPDWESSPEYRWVPSRVDEHESRTTSLIEQTGLPD